jgi:hypothetical protein
MFHVSKYFSNLIDKLSDSAKIKKKCTNVRVTLEMPVPSQGHYGFQFSSC